MGYGSFVVSSKQLRYFLDRASDDAIAAAICLRDQLRVNENSAQDATSGGSFSSTSANGRHVAFAMSGGGVSTPQEMSEAWRRLIDVYDQSLSDLGLVGGIATDVAVKAQMFGYLRELKGYTSNFMYLSK